ncbi:MAG: hypothetical protein WC076_12170 [Terrimicrobiaceae bacterium]
MLLRWIVAGFGRQIIDQRTGNPLGKALVLSLGGRPWLAGLHHPYVRPVFLPENRVKYGRHRIGFATHAAVDYPSLFPAASHPPPAPPLWAILVHQPAKDCRALLDHWEKLGFDPADLLLVHGGSKEDFNQLDSAQAVFVPDSNLRTVRHPVEKQSYSGPMREISKWMSALPYRHVCLVEHDHLPLVPDWGRRLADLLAREQADVLFHHLIRVDGTNAPHYLYHQSDPRFHGAWEPVSRREDPHVVLNCMATGSFWTREAFDAVASCATSREAPASGASGFRFPISDFSSIPIYLEMCLPTTAHHLGFRVRDFGSQNSFVHFNPLSPGEIAAAAARGAWSLHPIKRAG